MENFWTPYRSSLKRGVGGKPGCDEGQILTQEPEKEITFAQGFSFPLKPWDFNYLTFIVIWRHFIQINFKENQNQAPGFISEELNTSEILDCQGRNSGTFFKE